MTKKSHLAWVCILLSLLLLAAAATPAAAAFWEDFAKQGDAGYVVPGFPPPVAGDLDGSGTLEPWETKRDFRTWKIVRSGAPRVVLAF